MQCVDIKGVRAFVYVRWKERKEQEAEAEVN